jgi:hypothetical protein
LLLFHPRVLIYLVPDVSSLTMAPQRSAGRITQLQYFY